MMLELRALTKSYGPSPILKGVSLTIGEGEFFSILGPSGCGKTTLLRILDGLESPTSGQVYLDGVRLNKVPANGRPFNMVFQRYALFSQLSVWDNVAFGLQVKKVPSDELKARVQDALALVMMENFGSREISTLSGGQQQRIALARALVNRPKVLLLDEPLSALDLKLRQQMQVELLSLQHRLKHTFVYVTHNQEEALALSDRIAVMNDGKIEQVGSPREIYENPRSLFVAQFIGSINSIHGVIREVRSDCITVLGFGERSWGVRPSKDGIRVLPKVEVGAKAWILVRPEKLRVFKSMPRFERGEIEGNWIKGIVRTVLYGGAVTELQIQPESGSEPNLKVSVLNNATNEQGSFQVGESVHLAWNPEDCILMVMEDKNPSESC